MIPFIIAENNDVINLTQIVRVKIIGKETEVYFADGTMEIVTGAKAERINSQIMFNVKLWIDYQRQLTSGIITK